MAWLVACGADEWTEAQVRKLDASLSTPTLLGWDRAEWRNALFGARAQHGSAAADDASAEGEGEERPSERRQRRVEGDEAAHERRLALVVANCALVRVAASQRAALDLLDSSSQLDAALVFGTAFRVFVTVLYYLLKLVLFLVALVVFGPEGVGIAVLRAALRALIAVMRVLTPLVRVVFPRFRFEVAHFN